MNVKIEASWKEVLADEFKKPYFKNIVEHLKTEKEQGKVIYPPGPQIFHAFEATPFEAVKVVLLGQDPYHGPGQAHGLAFSVLPGVDVPPSLQNIFTEIERDLAIPRPDHGCLVPWARGGVLLLNAVLTVEHGRAGSHQGRGWEAFTDAVVALLNRERQNLVFLLWGAYAQRKGQIIDPRRHKVLRAPHPSPLSCHRGFAGCGHFSAANRYLAEHAQAPVDWRLPPRAMLETGLAAGAVAS